MIKFKNISNGKPYIQFKKKYDEAINAGQDNIEAISISSFNKVENEVDSRFVNLKFIIENDFIFFSNYDSPKSLSFESHDQISALFFWSSTNTQIRMKARIKKTSIKFNKEYFKKRSVDKNALAISSDQSKKILSYNEILKKYNNIKKSEDLSVCPDYWGGFSFTPYYFEFWKGDQSRINKRKIFQKINGEWDEFFLQP